MRARRFWLTGILTLACSGGTDGSSASDDGTAGTATSTDASTSAASTTEVDLSCMVDADCPSQRCVDVDGEKQCMIACPGLPSGSNALCIDIRCPQESCGGGEFFCWSIDGAEPRFCRCDLVGPDVCNGRDDDCDRVIDPPETANADCEAKMGAGSVCQMGECAPP